MTQAQNQRYFTRKEAAAYLTGIGCPITPKTLANMASNNNSGGGPSYIRIHWHRVRYTQDDLDAWAKSRMRRVR